jgi:hypothetical protein
MAGCDERRAFPVCGSSLGCGAAQQIVEKSGKILLGPGVDDHGADLAGGDIETGDRV